LAGVREILEVTAYLHCYLLFFFVARDRQGHWPHLFPGIMIIRAGEEEEEEEEIVR
jgi:hypothetical protein